MSRLIEGHSEDRATRTRQRSLGCCRSACELCGCRHTVLGELKQSPKLEQEDKNGIVGHSIGHQTDRALGHRREDHASRGQAF